jgi:hypothetical protein
MKSKKVKVVYKHLYTTFKFLFKTPKFQEQLSGISCGRPRTLDTYNPGII